MRKIAVLLLTMVVMVALASVASAKARTGDMLYSKMPKVKISGK